MGCLIERNVINSYVDLTKEENQINSISTKKTKNNKNLYEKIPDYYPQLKEKKSLFRATRKVSNNNFINTKTNCSSLLLNNTNELILIFSKENEQNYDKISIFQNILTSLYDENIKIIKDDPLHAIFSFGGKIKEKIRNDNSSQFESSNIDEIENVDYLFNENNIQPHQFDIEYDEGKYYIKGYNDGSGIFFKVNQKINIGTEDKYIFLFNNKSFVNFQVLNNQGIVLIEYNGENKGEFNYLKNNIILIGRSKICNIILNEDEGISRVQFSFYYDKNNNDFYLYYCYFSLDENKCKLSTNGIWLLIENKIQINKEMMLKTGNSVILGELKEKE